jgi:hypothetical protein
MTIMSKSRVAEIQAVNSALADADPLIYRVTATIAHVRSNGIKPNDPSSIDATAASARFRKAVELVDEYHETLRAALLAAADRADALALELADEERAIAEATAAERRRQQFEGQVASAVAEAESARLKTIEDDVRARLARSAGGSR